MLVKDIFPGAQKSYPSPAWLTNVNGTLFCSADDGSAGQELWKSDGTLGGTVLVKDIVPGFGGSVPAGLVDAHGTLVFSAWDSAHGVEPWISDGSASGTLQVQDIAPGATHSNPMSFTVVDGHLFFTANDSSNGQELWMLPMAATRPVAATISDTGGQLVSLLDDTTYNFSAGTFNMPVTVTHRVRAPDSAPTAGSLVSIDHVFEVTAVDSTTGQPVQPTQPYTITIRYADAERGPAIEATLALYFWDGSQWVREPSSTGDQLGNTIVARPNHFSVWAVLGETHRRYLPIISRS